MTATPQQPERDGNHRPKWGLTKDEVERVRQIVGLAPDPSDDGADAEITPEEIEAILLASDFGLPKNVRNITHENIEPTLDLGIARVRESAGSSAAKLLEKPPSVVMDVLNERETMSRTIHYAVAKQLDADAVIEYLGRAAAENGPPGPVLEFLWRQKEMANILERLFRIDIILRIGEQLRDERFDALALRRLENLVQPTIVSVRKFIDGNADAVAGSLHMKILTEELLQTLTEKPPKAMLERFFTEICMRYADLVSADLSQFNAWRLSNALSA